MPLILGTNSIKDTGFSVSNSLRFDTVGSENLKFTPSTYSSSTTGTFSWWIKRGVLSNEAHTVIWSNTYTNDNNRTYISINGNDQLGTSVQYSGSSSNTYTNMVLRDTSAWYHCVIRYNSTESSQSDRVKIWVNGELQSLSSSAGTPTGGITAFQTSLSNAHGWNFIYGSPGSGLQNAYLAQCVYCDGQSYSASDFGEFDTDSPTIWKPKDLSDLNFGNNGYYLDYGDSSNLGADVSGNGNNLTSSGFSSDNHVTDTPTNNGNVHNALIKDTPTLSDGNLNVTTSTTGWESATGTIGVNKGKWYCEYKVVNKGGAAMFGVISMTEVNAIASGKHIGYSGINSLGYGYNHNGNKYNNDNYSSYGDSYTTNDIIGIAMDLDNHKLYFSKNGTFQNSGDPTSGSTGTGSAYDLATGYYYTFGCSVHSSSDQMSGNFGSPSYSISSGNSDANGHGNFEYSVPSGYYALNTKNLAEFG